jgi:hypothetical protein
MLSYFADPRLNIWGDPKLRNYGKVSADEGWDGNAVRSIIFAKPNTATAAHF